MNTKFFTGLTDRFSNFSVSTPSFVSQQKLTDALNSLQQQLTTMASEMNFSTAFTDGGTIITQLADTDPARAYARLQKQVTVLQTAKKYAPYLLAGGVASVVVVGGAVIITNHAKKHNWRDRLVAKRDNLKAKWPFISDRRPPTADRRPPTPNTQSPIPNTQSPTPNPQPQFTNPTTAFVQDLALAQTHVILMPIAGEAKQPDVAAWEGILSPNDNGFKVSTPTEIINFPFEAVVSVSLTVENTGSIEAIIAAKHCAVAPSAINA